MLSILSAGVNLTGSAAEGTNVARVSGFGQHTLYVEYNPDTDATNALTVTIECSPDGGTHWFPFTGEYTDGVGTITQGAQITLSYSSDGTAAQAQAPFTFFVNADQVRIKASETNTPGDFGSYSAWLLSSH